MGTQVCVVCVFVCMCLNNYLHIIRRCQASYLSHQVPCLLGFCMFLFAINYHVLINVMHDTFFFCVYMCVHESVSTCVSQEGRSCMSILLTSPRRLKASVRAMSNMPMPLANSLLRCSRKCCENKVWEGNIKIMVTRREKRGHY